MSAPAVPVAAKKPARGVLRVKVTGSGSYTIRAKGYRKTSNVTKTFRVKPGKYTVKAPGATVKPKKTVRVRTGKTMTVRIGFPKKTPAPGPTPTPTPTVSPTPSESPTVPGNEQTVVSDGGPLSVAVPGVTVEAPAGAIAAGQTLTVRKEPGMDLPRGGVPGSGLTLTTSQGQPAKPVTVTLSYTPGAVERPLIVHREQGSEPWVPEQTIEVAPGKVQSVWASFSSGGLVDYFVYAVGNLTGNRASLPDPCRQPPSFVVNHDFSNDSTNVNDSLFSCHTTASSEDWVGVELTNNRGYPLMMRITGGQFDLTGASMPTSTVSALNQAISRVANLGSGKTDVLVLAPGSATSVRIPRSDPRTTVSVQAQGVVFSSVAGAGLSLLGQDKRLETSVKLMDCIAAALHSLNTGSTIDEGLSAVRTCADAALAAGENSFVYFPDLSPAEFKKLASGLGKLAKAILVVDVGQRIADAWVDGLFPPRLEYTTEQRIRPIDPPPHPKTVNTYIARDPDTGRSVLVDRGRVTTIGTGTLFNCLARTRAVWDISNLKALKQTADGAQLSCYDEGPEWTYTPTAQGGNTGTNIILRNTNGNAWLINNAGEIQTIEDGGTYLCLATTNPVIWNTPDDKITEWTRVGVEPASCGPTDPLPLVAPAPFSKLMSTYLSDQSWTPILQPAANGWWLMAQYPGADGGSFTYQWIGPDGRQGPHWTSAVAPVAMATVDGTVFVTDGSRLYRAGSNRFERSTGGSVGWGGGLGTLQTGADGFLYWLQDSGVGGSPIIRKIDPADLSLNGIVRLPALVLHLYATAQGLVAYAPNSDGEKTWGIPYASFTADVETDAPSGLGSLIPGEQFTVNSVGLDGGIAEASSSDGDCTADVGYRSAAGIEWRKSMQQLLAADYEPSCGLVDFDSLPDGGVVFTLLIGPTEQQRGYLLEVSASGVRQRLTQVINLGVGRLGASEVADDGTVVTTAQVNWDCPEDEREPGNYTCGDTRVIGFKDGQQQFTTTWTSPTGLISPSGHVGNGSSGIYIGQNQVAAWVVQSCPSIIGSIGCQTNQEEAFFRTIAVPMNLPLRSGYIPR